jgi:hypothetical protein
MMPSRNMVMANALIKCITLRLKLVGLFGSLFLKKYIRKYSWKKLKAKSVKLKENPKQKRLPVNREPLANIV